MITSTFVVTHYGDQKQRILQFEGWIEDVDEALDTAIEAARRTANVWKLRTREEIQNVVVETPVSLVGVSILPKGEAGFEVLKAETLAELDISRIK